MSTVILAEKPSQAESTPYTSKFFDQLSLSITGKHNENYTGDDDERNHAKTFLSIIILAAIFPP